MSIDLSRFEGFIVEKEACREAQSVDACRLDTACPTSSRDDWNKTSGIMWSHDGCPNRV